MTSHGEGNEMARNLLPESALTPLAQKQDDEDVADGGNLSNGSRRWACQPETEERFLDLMSETFEPSGLGFRQRGVSVAAMASTLADSYCSFGCGGKLAESSDGELAAAVLTGTEEGLTEQEAAMASWARTVMKDPTRQPPLISIACGTPVSATHTP